MAPPPRSAPLLVVLAGCLSSACSPAGYLAQAAWGELGILHAARPLTTVSRDPSTPARLRGLLGQVEAIKAFGQRHGLKPTHNYQRYADLHRAAAVWVVQASAPLAFDTHRWQFPVVGSAPYLGFFDQGAAQRFAASLAAAEGLDVWVRGASTYSTLGWFDDPVLSTMIASGDDATGWLADEVLHESVHATLYLKAQSAFDESLASFVAERLSERWLTAAYGPTSAEVRAWAASRAKDAASTHRLHQAYLELDALYRSGESDEAKRAAKARILSAAQQELELTRPLNNAALSGYRLYQTGEGAFTRLLTACGGNWRSFFAALETLTPSDFGHPQRDDFDEVIDRLTTHPCRSPSPAGSGSTRQLWPP